MVRIQAPVETRRHPASSRSRALPVTVSSHELDADLAPDRRAGETVLRCEAVASLSGWRASHSTLPVLAEQLSYELAPVDPPSGEAVQRSGPRPRPRPGPGPRESTGGQSAGQFTLIPMPTTTPPGLRPAAHAGLVRRGAARSPTGCPRPCVRSARPGRPRPAPRPRRPRHRRCPTMRSFGHFSDSSTPAATRQARTAASATAQAAR